MRAGFRWLYFNFAYLFQRPRWETGISPPELVDFLRDHAPGHALDLGCGTGVNLLAMARAGWQVTGVDYAIPAVIAARQRLRRAGISADVRLESVTDLRSVAGAFDLIFDVGCYFGLPDAEKLAYEGNLQRLLAPGGYFLVYMYLRTPENPFGATETDIVRLSELLAPVQRADSPDRFDRPSTWLLFQRESIAL